MEALIFMLLSDTGLAELWGLKLLSQSLNSICVLVHVVAQKLCTFFKEVVIMLHYNTVLSYLDL